MGQVASGIKSTINTVIPEKQRGALKREISFFCERAKFFKEITLLDQDEFLGKYIPEQD